MMLFAMWMGRWDLILGSGSGLKGGREVGRRMGWCFRSEVSEVETEWLERGRGFGGLLIVP